MREMEQGSREGTIRKSRKLVRRRAGTGKDSSENRTRNRSYKRMGKKVGQRIREGTSRWSRAGSNVSEETRLGRIVILSVEEIPGRLKAFSQLCRVG
jgi:hypothetical protein